MEEVYDLIERYFENALNKQELAAFQLRLKEDAAFAQLFALEKDVRAGIEAMGNEQLKSELQTIHQEETGNLNKQSEQIKASSTRRLWLLAAAAIALLLLYFFLFRNDQPPTTEELYLAYFEPDYDLLERGDDKKWIADLERHLQQKNYPSALTILDSLLNTPNQNAPLLIYQGIARMESGQYSAARESFNNAGKANSLYQDDANWYLGLNFLKQGDKQKAQQALSEIPATSPRYTSARALIDQLK